jgi:hypothetical protein
LSCTLGTRWGQSIVMPLIEGSRCRGDDHRLTPMLRLSVIIFQSSSARRIAVVYVTVCIVLLRGRADCSRPIARHRASSLPTAWWCGTTPRAQSACNRRCSLTALCCAVLCCAVLCCAVLCCAVLCCAVLCCAVLCCAVLGSGTCCADVLCHPGVGHACTSWGDDGPADMCGAATIDCTPSACHSLGR